MHTTHDLSNIEVVMCCVPRDLRIARLAVGGIRKYVSGGPLTIVTRKDAFAETRKALNGDVNLVDERELLGGMSIEQLKLLYTYEGFPSRAGWYLQQIAKLGYCFVAEQDKHYLIWDCDTVPLRRLELFTADGRPLYTLADERHLPYFDTYEKLFVYKPDYIGSFISQHMVIDKGIAREMLGEIATRHPTEKSWSWAIMNNLAKVKSLSLFSEYETYGYYATTRHESSVAFRRLPWIRDGALYTADPTKRQLRRLSKQYYFVAFESWQFEQARTQNREGSIYRRMIRLAKRWLGLEAL